MTIKLNGISSRIDECAGLIIQKARRNYQKLNYNDKSWIDPEDVLQEGLMAACEAEATFQPFKKKKPAIGPVPTNKFSTYLYTGLDFRYRRFREYLGTKKRSTWQVVFSDIDSLLKEDGTSTLGDTLESASAPAITELVAIESFLQVCQRISSDAFVLLVESVLIGERRNTGSTLCPVLVGEIRQACRDVGLSFGELEFLIKNEDARIFILAKLSGVYNMGKDVQATAEQSKLKLLVCRECRSRFSLDAIAKGLYFVATYTCKGCYDEMADSPSSVTCFGKKKISTVQEGYSAEDIECQIHCTDRKFCQQYVNRKEEEEKMPKKTQPALEEEDLDDIEVDDLEEEDSGELPVKKSKTSIALGKKKAPVEEAPEEEAEDVEEEAEPEEEEEDDSEEAEEEPEESEEDVEEEPEEEEEAEPEEEEPEEAPEPVKAKKVAKKTAAPVKAAATKKKVAAPVKKAAAPAKKVAKKAAAPVKATKKAAPVKATKTAAKTGKKAPVPVATKSAKGAKGSKAVAPVKGKKAVAKKAVAKKAEPMIADLYPAPAEVGGRWPHKRGSVARYCFQRAFKGVKAADLQAEVEKFGRSWPIMLKVMTDGYTGKIRTTHRWRLETKGGRIKIVDVEPLHLTMGQAAE